MYQSMEKFVSLIFTLIAVCDSWYAKHCCDLFFTDELESLFMRFLNRLLQKFCLFTNKKTVSFRNISKNNSKEVAVNRLLVEIDQWRYWHCVGHIASFAHSTTNIFSYLSVMWNYLYISTSNHFATYKTIVDKQKHLHLLCEWFYKLILLPKFLLWNIE